MPSYAALYHPLQRVYAICTTRILLLKITTFCLEYDRNSTAADLIVGGCYCLNYQIADHKTNTLFCQLSVIVHTWDILFHRCLSQHLRADCLYLRLWNCLLVYVLQVESGFRFAQKRVPRSWVQQPYFLWI